MGPFRDEKETLRAELERKDAELATAKQKIAKLEEALHPPPPPPSLRERAPRVRARAAWIATTIFAVLASVSLASFKLAPAASHPLVWIAALAGLVSLVLGTIVVHRACDEPFSYSMFVTVFWVPFCCIPMLGGIIALVRVIILARGKFGAATITSNGDSTYYDAKDIGRNGWPLALFFLVVAAIHGAMYRLHILS